MAEWRKPEHPDKDRLDQIAAYVVNTMGAERELSPQEFEETFGISLEQLILHSNQFVTEYISQAVKDKTDLINPETWQTLYAMGIVVGRQLNKKGTIHE